MHAYKARTLPIAGTRYSDIAPEARRVIKSIAKRTKRRPYIRSAHFKKDKIFLNHFWDHVLQRPRYQRARRLKYLPCAIELVRKSTLEPISKPNVDRPRETLHRFEGLAPNDVRFYVQIKENQHTERKELMSIFPL